MKRAAVIFVMLAATSLAVGQQKATGSPTTPGQSTPAAQAAAPAPPQGKRPPAAKTQKEFDAYQAAVANAHDPAALEKAADDFATNFPDSELRLLLYKSAARAYQNVNNGDKMAEMAEKELKLDPDDPEALIGAAEVIAEKTRDTDLDKDQRWAQAQKYAQHATETVDTDVAIPANTPQEKVDAYKGFLRSSAYSVLGTIEFNQEKFVEAEGYFRKSIDALPSQPDPVVILRLAIALDKQGKYQDALKEANRAVAMTQESNSTGMLARRERDRLLLMTGGSPAPTSAPPAGVQNPNPPSH